MTNRADSPTMGGELNQPSLRQLLGYEGAEFVRAAFRALLGREADAQGLGYYTQRLAEGALRIDLIREIASSDEAQTQGRKLPGLPARARPSWWQRLPLIRRAAGDPRAQDRQLAQALTTDAVQLELRSAMQRLDERVTRLQQAVDTHLTELKQLQLLSSCGMAARDEWEAIQLVLGFRADQFIHKAFELALRRPPQGHELEHFRHLQAVGFGSAALLGSLLMSAEGQAVRGLGLKPQPATASPLGLATQAEQPRPADTVPSQPQVSGPKSGMVDGIDIGPLVTLLSQVSFRPAGDPLVSVIIPVYGKVGYTLRCLVSIATNRPHCSFEVIVVDDKSPDNTVELMQGILGLRLVINEVNLGFVRTCNHGAAQARGKYLCFLNNDTEVKPAWLDELVATFDEFPKAGMVGSKLVYPDGSLQEAGGILWNDASAWNYGRGQDPSRSVFNYARETDYCSGASILIEKQLFERLGCFDERYVPAYCEDSSLAFEVRRAGLEMIYQPKSEVVHYEGVSHGTSTSSGIKAYQVENQRKFFDLWHDTLANDHFANAQHVFLARERAATKRVVLVIDHYVPQPDRDAGSRTMWHILTTLRSRGFAVKFWPENLHRDPDYTPALERKGIEVIYGAEYANGFAAWMQENGVYLDAVLLSRPHISMGFLPHLRPNTRAPILYYGHDVHHLRLKSQLALQYDVKVQEAMDKVERQEKAVWRQVDTVLYPSDEETAYVRQWLAANRLTAQARTLPPYAYDMFSDDAADQLHARQDIMFVAGFGHPPNSDAAVWLVEQVMPLVHRQAPQLRVWLVGSNPTDAVKRLHGTQVTVTGYVTDEQLAQHYQHARLAVAPLLYGGGVKGKVVEAMRFGLPCVTTPAGGQGLADTEHFLAVHSEPQAFADEILRLIKDDSLWRQRSGAALAYVKQHYSVDSLANALTAEFNATPYANVSERLQHMATAQR